MGVAIRGKARVLPNLTQKAREGLTIQVGEVIMETRNMWSYKGRSKEVSRFTSRSASELTLFSFDSILTYYRTYF